MIPYQWGFGLWACLPDPKRVLGTQGVPLFGEVRLRCAALTPAPCVWERGIHLLVLSCMCCATVYRCFDPVM